MNTIIYFDRHTEHESEDMALTVTSLYGVPPRLMKIGVDVTKEEVEDLCVIDLDALPLPIVTSADSDDVIDIYDTDEEIEVADHEADPTWIFEDYSLET